MTLDDFDAFSRKVVGWALADHLEASLAIEALDMAIEGLEQVVKPKLEPPARERAVEIAVRAQEERDAAEAATDHDHVLAAGEDRLDPPVLLGREHREPVGRGEVIERPRGVLNLDEERRDLDELPAVVDAVAARDAPPARPCSSPWMP